MKRHILNGVMDATGWIVLGITVLAALWLVWDALRDKRKHTLGDTTDG